MKIPKNLADAIENLPAGKYLPNDVCAGKLAVGETKISEKGKKYPSSLGYFKANPEICFSLFFANNAMEIYQQVCYRFVKYRDKLIDNLNDVEKKAARQTFYFNIKNLQRDISCCAELRDTKTQLMICYEAHDLIIGNHYKLMTNFKFNENGEYTNQKNTDVSEQKVSFAWVEKNYGKKHEDPHFEFQAAVAKTNGQKCFTYKLRINCFPVFLNGSYILFESGGTATTIKNIFVAIKKLENYIEHVKQMGNIFDISTVTFWLSTEIAKSDKFGSSKSYAVTNLGYIDNNSKNYKNFNNSNFLQIE